LNWHLGDVSVSNPVIGIGILAQGSMPQAKDSWLIGFCGKGHSSSFSGPCPSSAEVRQSHMEGIAAPNAQQAIFATDAVSGALVLTVYTQSSALQGSAFLQGQLSKIECW